MRHSLLIAAVLILAVLYLFLRDVRAALIAFTAIPLSLLAAIAVLDRMGFTLNTMTLGGFAVALGVLVDDAIIGIENILRRLRENGALRASPSPAWTWCATHRWRFAVRSFMRPQWSSRCFCRNCSPRACRVTLSGPLALAFIFAVLASLLVALTSTPALCALLLRRHDARAEAAWLVRLKILATLRGSSASRITSPSVAAVLIGLVVAAIVALPFLGGTFMPDFREGHFVLQVSSAATGTSLETMLEMGKRVSAEVLALPYVQSIEQQVGRAELGEDTWGPHRSEFHVELKADTKIDQHDAEAQLRKILARLPGLQSEVVTFLGDRISESLSGETAQVAVKVFGDDLDALDSTGGKIVGVLGKVPGIVDLQFKRQSGTPAIGIELQPQAMAAAGLKAQDVLDTINTAYAGSCGRPDFPCHAHGRCGAAVAR